MLCRDALVPSSPENISTTCTWQTRQGVQNKMWNFFVNSHYIINHKLVHTTHKIQYYESFCGVWVTLLLYIMLYTLLYVLLYILFYILLYISFYILLYFLLYILLYVLLYIFFYILLYILLYVLLYILWSNKSIFLVLSL